MADGTLNFDTKISTKGLEKGVSDIKKTITSISETIKSFKADFGNISTVVNSVNKSIRFLTDEVKKINMYLNDTAQATQNVESNVSKVNDSVEKLDEPYRQIDKVIDEWAKNQERIAEETKGLNEALSFDTAESNINQVKESLYGVKEEYKEIQNSSSENTKSNFFNILIKSAEKLDSILAKLADKFSKNKIEINTDTTGLNALEEEIQKSERLLSGSGKGKKISLIDNQETLSEIQKVQTALNALYEKQRKFLDLGQDTSSKPYQSLIYDINEAKAQLASLANAYINTLKPGATLDTSGIDRLIEHLKLLQSANQQANQSTEETNTNVKKTEKGITSLIKRFIGVKKSSKNSFDSVGKSIKSGLKKILAYGFGIRSLFRLFNTLRGYATDAFKAMATQFPDVNKPLSDIKNSFTQAKNSIATAFQPLLTTVAPIITQITDLFTRAMNVIGQFFATLTGQKYIYKAAEANESFADSQDSVAESTKEANKQLASYDDLQVITQENSDNATSSSSSGDTGGFVTETIDPTSQVSDFANKVKEAWEKADFTEIGTIIRDKLVNALNSINWESINEKGLQISSSIATLINGFFAPSLIDGKEVYTLGESIGNLLSGALNTATSFIDNFVWKLDTHSIGANISVALQKVFTDYNWGSLGSIISGIVAKGWDFVTGLIEGIDWRALPGQIKDKCIEYLQGVKWGEVLKSVSKCIGAAIGAVGNLLRGIWDEIVAGWNKFVDWKNDLNDAGKSIWEGLWEGIKEFASNAWDWVVDNLFTPIWDSIKKAWGINSPSKKMEEIGGYIIDGLKNGIGNVWEKIKQKFTELWTKLSEYLGNIKENVKTKGENIINSLKNGIGNVWNKIKEKFTELWTKLSEYLGNIKDNVKTKGENIINSLKSGLGNIWSKIKQKFTDMWQSMKDWFAEKVKPKISLQLPTWSEIKEKLKELVNKAIDFLNNNIIKKINNFLSFTVPDNAATQLLGIGGKSYKLGSIPNIPKLATGAYIPANYGEFIATLGDNRTQAEIVSPVPEMKKAMLEVISEFFKNTPSNQPVYLYLDGKQIASAVWDETSKRYKQTGKSLSY